MAPPASWLAALDARIEREILRLRGRYELSLDEFRGLYISDAQVDQLVGASRHESSSQPTAPLLRPSLEIRGDHTRWRHLAETFSLSPLEEDLVLIALAPELNLKYETLYAYLNNDVTRKRPTGDLAARLMSDVADTDEVARALAAAGTLRARRLLRCTHAGIAQALVSVEYAADPCVSHWIRGLSPGLAIESEGIEWADTPALSQFDLEAATRATPILQLLTRWSRRTGSLPLVALTGQPGSGRAETAAAVASGSGRPLVKIDLSSTNDTEAESEALERTAIALALVPGVVLLDGAEALLDSDGARRRDRARWTRRIARWSASSLVMMRAEEHEQFRALIGAGRVIEIRCGEDGFDHRMNAWRHAARTRDVQLSAADLASLAGRFALTAGQVRSALATACDMVAMAGTGTPDASQIAAAARQASDQSLGRLAMKIDRKHDWADLVLPATTLQRLREFAAAIRHRHLVFGEWGFGERIVHGAGMKALFAGASGTGKTMAAGVIARALGLDLFKVDLSGVVSKYIGETEKNLDRVFRAARSSNAIVFLDEADAILGKRSEVRDAHDRYANIEVAYLLQCLEEHDGVVILATNLRRNIDEAFNRRMQYVIDFPRPEEAERERIWRGMFPPQSPVAPDVDFMFLARQFDLAGGEIRNVALDAAFIAAQEQSAIDMRAIVEALSRQLAKQGKTPTGTDFRQYQRLRPVAGGKPDSR
jgi:SpoVK/Ycf46/Vps4 family AAA+-type ATPase